MTTPYKSKFVDGTGNIFTVQQVVESPVGLTVHYTSEATGQQFSCLLEAFGQRFREIQND